METFEHEKTGDVYISISKISLGWMGQVGMGLGMELGMEPGMEVGGIYILGFAVLIVILSYTFGCNMNMLVHIVCLPLFNHEPACPSIKYLPKQNREVRTFSIIDLQVFVRNGRQCGKLPI